MRRVASPSRRARGLRLLLALVGVTLATVSACSTGNDAVNPTAAGQYRYVQGNKAGQLIAEHQRKPAPAFTGTLMNGETASLSDYRGKVVALNFWAAWCPPCRVEAPDLEQVYRAEHAAGLQIIGVDVKDDKGKAESFIRDKHITYPSFWDPRGRAALTFRDFNPNAIPSTILLDRRGRVAGVYVTSLLGSDLTRAVRPLLAAK